ncbi:unnamed protein product [Sphagnum jensenii]
MGIRAISVPFLETATSTDHAAEPLSAATILYKSFLSIKSSRKVQQKEFDASTAAAIWVCDCLEKVFVRMFADSDHMTTAAAHPAADQKSGSSHFHLDGYYAPVDGETIPTSNLPVSGSIPIGDMYGLKGILLGFLYLLRVLLGVLDISNGFGTANTGFVYHHNKLLALYEADKPYAIKVKEDGDLETVGREQCGSQFSDYLTAHPKIDPVTANAWEEGDEVVLISCHAQKTNTKIWREKFPQENHVDLEKPQLYEFRINLKTNEVTQKQLSLLAIECPKINEEYTGRKQQYVYASIYDDKLDKFTGVVKYDLSLQPEINPKDSKVEGNIQRVFYHGDRRWGSEATFVPRTNGKQISEDDGYLICFVHDEKSG